MTFSRLALHSQGIMSRIVPPSAFVGLFLLCLFAAQAQACSCADTSDWGFIVPENGRLPANAAGVPWYSSSSSWLPGIAQRFTVEVQENGEFRSLPVKVDPLEGLYSLYVVAPQDGRLQAGATYRFTVDKVAKHSEGHRQVTVTIDHQELADNVPLSLEVGPAEKTFISVPLSGQCATTLWVAQVRIEAQLPPESQRWREQLLYRTVIDGERTWYGMRNLCSHVRSGRTWEAVGHDRIYAGCERRDWHGAHLEPGRHALAMQAILPGTNIVLETPVTTVDLGCSWLDGIRLAWRELTGSRPLHWVLE